MSQMNLPRMTSVNRVENSEKVVEVQFDLRFLTDQKGVFSALLNVDVPEQNIPLAVDKAYGVFLERLEKSLEALRAERKRYLEKFED